MDYKLYRNSTEWKNKKEEVIKIKGNKCERCKDEKNVSVHHGTYERIGKEPISDLFVLCSSCHISFHNKYGCSNLILSNTVEFIKSKKKVHSWYFNKYIKGKFLKGKE